MANYKVLATWDINIQNLYKDITLIQEGISCKLNISLRSISRVTVNYKVGNEYVTDLCRIDLDNNKVIVPFKKNVLEVGMHTLELVCHMKNGDVLPTPNYSYTVTKSLDNTNDITEEDAYPVLIGMIQELTKNEAIIQANEEARANAEMYRELHEDERQNAEAERKRNENTRISNENTRKSNESSRQQYETQRRVEEDERLTDEQVRVNAENIRIANENERLRKEIERQNAEELRQIAYNSSLYARMDEAESQLTQIENKTYTTYLIKNSEWGISSEFTNSTSTTNGINNAIRYAKDNGYTKVIFEKGEYLIQCDDNTPDNTRPKGGIMLLSDMEYDLNDSSFKIMDNLYTAYAIFRIENISNVVIKNGTIIGDRPRHDYTSRRSTHEFGCGVFLSGGHNIDVLNNTIYDFTGDCITIMCSQKWDATTNTNMQDRNSERINVIGNDLSHSRRQGISVCSAEDINIKNNVIHHIGNTEDGIEGTAPQFGIDLEGYTDAESINRCVIENNHFNNNLRADIYCASRVKHVVIRNNTCIRADDDTYVIAIGDGGDPNTTGTKHCIIDGNYIENGGIKSAAWNLFIVNNVVKCVGGNNGIDARYHKIKNGEGGTVTISNNQIESGSIQIMHCNFASVTNNILNNSKDVIEFGIHHNQLTSTILNNPSKSLITGNIINGNYNKPISAYSFDPNIVNISDCKFDTTGLMPSGYLKNCMIKLTRDSDCIESYNPFRLDNCTIYYNGYRILYCWTDDECLITNCSFYNTDNTKTKSIITYAGKNPQFTITNNYFYNCNDSVVIDRSKNKCILVNNYFEKTSSTLKNVISNPWNATGEEVSIYKNNVVVNFNEVNK